MQTNAQATIYVTAEAYQTAQTIKDLDYNDRVSLCDEQPDLVNRSGYHFKNANKLNIAPLPAGANINVDINLVLDPKESPLVAMPVNLRGCIFERAPNLPAGYADIVAYWSGETINTNTSGAVYFQCKLNEYMVDLGPDPVDAPVINDRLLSEGVVVAISGLARLLQGLSPDDFIQFQIPVDQEMLSLEPDDFQSAEEYDATSERCEQVFLKVADILASPDPDRIYIDLLCNELLDYGYWY